LSHTSQQDNGLWVYDMMKGVHEIACKIEIQFLSSKGLLQCDGCVFFANCFWLDQKQLGAMPLDLQTQRQCPNTGQDHVHPGCKLSWCQTTQMNTLTKM